MTLLYQATAETIRAAARAARRLAPLADGTTAQPVVSPLEWPVDPAQPHSMGQTNKPDPPLRRGPRRQRKQPDISAERRFHARWAATSASYRT